MVPENAMKAAKGGKQLMVSHSHNGKMHIKVQELSLTCWAATSSCLIGVEAHSTREISPATRDLPSFPELVKSWT